MCSKNSILVLCAFLFFSACGGGSSNSPVAPVTQTTVENPPAQSTEQTGTTLAAAPTAQPTQPLVPHGSIWVTGRLFMSGSDINSDCETQFKNIPTVQIWKKTKDEDWQLYHKLGKPDPVQDDPETLTFYQCGKFGSSFGFWGPKEYPCLNEDQIKFVGIYHESSRKVYRGESKIYSCADRENPPSILIILELVNNTQMMLAPSSKSNKWFGL